MIKSFKYFLNENSEIDEYFSPDEIQEIKDLFTELSDEYGLTRLPDNGTSHKIDINCYEFNCYLSRIKRLNSKNEPSYEINKIEINFSIKAPRNLTDHIKIHNDIHAFNNRIKSHGYKSVLEQSRSGNAIINKLPPER